MAHIFAPLPLLVIFYVFVAGAFGTAECMAEENARFWILRGKALNESYRYKEAIKAFKQAVQMDPASEEAHLRLGNSYFEIGSYDAADDAFRQVLTLNPDNSTALFYLGLSLIQQTQYAESIPYFEKAGTLDSDFKQLSLFYIGEAQSELGDPLAASETWRRAINVDPTTDIARNAETLIKKMTQEKGDKPWFMSMSAGMEFDDNVTVSQQDLSTGLQDSAYIFEFSGAYKLLETPKFGLEVGYDFYQSIYDTLSEFDLQSHIFSLGVTRRYKKFDVDVFIQYNHVALGRKHFLETVSIIPQIGFFPAKSWFALTKYFFEDSRYFIDPARDGQNHGIGMDNFVFFNKGRSYLLFSYRFEDKTTRGDEFTYAGHFGTIAANTSLPFWNRRGKFNVAYSFFHKDYKHITPSLGKERYDLQHSFQVNLAQPLYKSLQLNLNYEHIDAVSNLPESDFTENIISFAFSVAF